MGFIENEVFETIERELEKALQEHPDLTNDELEAVTEQALQSSLEALFEVMPGALEKSSRKTIRTGRKLQHGFEEMLSKMA